MNDKRISPNLVRYFREMKNDATSHDKIILLLSGGILVYCCIGTYKDVVAANHWSEWLAVLVGLAIGTLVWLFAFGLGVLLRLNPWRPTFPPHQMIRRALFPAFVISILLGVLCSVVLFKLATDYGFAASLLGNAITFAVSYVLFVLHSPLTQAAIKRTGNPNIMTVDSHRYMWLFPALAVLTVSLTAMALAAPELSAFVHTTVSAGIATALVMAGFGAGYIP